MSASFLSAAAPRAADAAANEAPSTAPLATTTTTETQAQVTLRSIEDEEVVWPREAAESFGALVDWLSEAGGDGGAFSVSAPAAALRTLAHHFDDGAAALQGCTLAHLAHVVQAAHFLEADDAARRDVSRALCERYLAGKSPEELVGLLGASCDYESAAAQRAAVAEPAFEPDAPDAAAAPAAPPRGPLAVTRSLSTELINEDAAEAALAEADVPTLCALKGVSTAWRARARRVLCARLCASDGQPLPTSRDEVSDLDLGPMLGAGRLSDAAAARQLLPNLARVRARGFEMEVAAARATIGARTKEFSGQRPASFFEPGGLRGCIRGEGEPPADVLLGMCAVRDGEAHVPPYAFYKCSSLALTALPDGLTGIGDDAFEGCSSLALTALPDCLTSIGDCAFYGCSSLALTALSDCLTSIGDCAFQGCSSLALTALPRLDRNRRRLAPGGVWL